MESNNILKMEGYDWKAAIDMDQFFPCSQAQCKRLYKQYISQSHRSAEELIRQIVDYLLERMKEKVKEIEFINEAYNSVCEKREELKTEMRDKGYTYDKKKRKELLNLISVKNKEAANFARRICKGEKETRKMKDNGIFFAQLIGRGDE